MELKNKQERLSLFQSDQIDLTHMRTKDLALDASGVPSNITVGSLLEILNSINFDDPNLPGYMPPSSRSEYYGSNYSKAQLVEYINRFIFNVNYRVPFLGTPVAGPRLFEFYHQMNDALIDSQS